MKARCRKGHCIWYYAGRAADPRKPLKVWRCAYCPNTHYRRVPADA